MDRGTNANRVAIIGREREERVIKSERKGEKEREKYTNIKRETKNQRKRVTERERKRECVCAWERDKIYSEKELLSSLSFSLRKRKRPRENQAKKKPQKER